MKRAAALVLSAALIFAALILPNFPGNMNWGALQRWPLELPVILLSLAALGWRRGVPHLVALLLTVGVVLKLADYATFEAYNRPANPVLDLYLIQPAFSLMSDTLGPVPAAAALALLIVAPVAVFWAFLWAARRWAALGLTGPIRHIAGVLALLGAGWAAADAGHHLGAWKLTASPPGTAYTSRVIVRRSTQALDVAPDLIAFRQAAAADPFAGRTGLLDGLDGRDVLLIWVESYGRASFDNPLYSETHTETLCQAQAALDARGMQMRSGWLTAPTAGGQSWLSHATLATGLWTTDQARYAALIAAGPSWLFHIAREAGYRTAAVMPAITQPWPEADAMGFDIVLNADAMGYRGDRFRWVTMPDQFTLSAYAARLPPDPRPDFVQIALISSHAPWTPIADVVPWKDVGDGTVFNPMAVRGPTPKDLWDDRADVREAYRRSVDYALEVVFSHVARLEDAPLVIVLGDHQSAPFVAGSDSRDVAAHIIGPAEALARIEGWGWTPGLVPSADVPARRMDAFKGDFIEAFTRPINALSLGQ